MIKKLLFAGVLALAFNSSNAQITIFEDSFETYEDFAITGIGQWTMTDLDKKNAYGIDKVVFPNVSELKAFQIFNRLKTTPAQLGTQWASRTGGKHLICWNVAEAPFENNDWMISPKIKMGVFGNKLSFWVKPGHEAYGEEKFNVLVSTTDTNTTSFTKLNTNLIVTNPVVEWVEYTFDLDAYKGQDVYIAIQCVSDDQFALQIDDFKVTATEILAVNDIKKSSLSVYPNPTSDFLTISGSEVKSIEIYDATGKQVKSGLVGTDNRLDVRNLSVGNYILKVKSENGTTSHKFIKK